MLEETGLNYTSFGSQLLLVRMAEFVPTCDHHLADAYYNYLYPASHLCAIILITPLIYMFIRSRIQGTLNIPPLAFYITTFYFIIQFMKSISDIIWSKYVCHDLIISTMLASIGGTMYSTQTSILIGLLFHRLYKTFLGVPSMQLSNFTMFIFTICYIINIGLFLAAILSFVLGGVNIFVYTIAVILNVSLIIALFVMYIYKMRAIYKHDASNDDSLINTIVKVSVLAITSISITILAFLAVPILVIINSIHYEYFLNLILLTDIYTNALCIFLMYKRFDKYYYCVCGCFDSKFRKRVENENLNYMQKNGKAFRVHEDTKSVSKGETESTIATADPSIIV